MRAAQRLAQRARLTWQEQSRSSVIADSLLPEIEPTAFAVAVHILMARGVAAGLPDPVAVEPQP